MSITVKVMQMVKACISAVWTEVMAYHLIVDIRALTLSIVPVLARFKYMFSPASEVGVNVRRLKHISSAPNIVGNVLSLDEGTIALLNSAACADYLAEPVTSLSTSITSSFFRITPLGAPSSSVSSRGLASTGEELSSASPVDEVAGENLAATSTAATSTDDVSTSDEVVETEYLQNLRYLEYFGQAMDTSSGTPESVDSNDSFWGIKVGPRLRAIDIHETEHSNAATHSNGMNAIANAEEDLENMTADVGACCDVCAVASSSRELALEVADVAQCDNEEVGEVDQREAEVCVKQEYEDEENEEEDNIQDELDDGGEGYLAAPDNSMERMPPSRQESCPTGTSRRRSRPSKSVS